MFHGIYPTSSRVIINKEYKVVVTSNIRQLDWSPNNCVNIVKNSLGAMNHGTEFHHGLLIDNVILTKFHFAGLDTFQQTLLC